jgi:hypothetical protein
MAIVFINLARGYILSWVEQWVGNTIVLDVRFGPLFVRDNPVFENKSPLKSTISQSAFRAFADAVLGLRYLGVRLATGQAGDVPIRRIGAL